MPVLALLAVVLLLVLPLVLPGSGTAVNLDSSGDTAALIRADHHAKTLPSAGEAVAACLSALAVATVLLHLAVLLRAVGPVVPAMRHRFEERVLTGDAGTLASACRARRGPPALV